MRKQKTETLRVVLPLVEKRKTKSRFGAGMESGVQHWLHVNFEMHISNASQDVLSRQMNESGVQGQVKAAVITGRQ